MTVKVRKNNVRNPVAKAMLQERKPPQTILPKKGNKMEYDTVAELNYHLDHEFAQALDITLDELYAMPLLEVEKLRRKVA